MGISIAICCSVLLLLCSVVALQQNRAQLRLLYLFSIVCISPGNNDVQTEILDIWKLADGLFQKNLSRELSGI